MRAILLLSCLLSSLAGLLAARAEDRAAFEAWKVEYGKVYADAAEEAARFATWEANRAEVSRQNTLLAATGEGHRVGLNAFADVSPEDFVRQRCGMRPDLARARAASARRGVHAVPPAEVAALPDTVDWRTSGLVTPPKNQGQCGSCWAFAAVASIEGQHARKSGALVSLSEQNLVDCVHNETMPGLARSAAGKASGGARVGDVCCDGCQGGLMDAAFEYLLDHQGGGIDDEADYAYRGMWSRGTCQYKPGAVGAKITGWVDVPMGDEAALMHAVATVGPVAVGVDARAWQFYLGGVFRAFLCSTDPAEMDHGVTVVGYGTTKATGVDYWIVKNSWGGFWGEGGYVRVQRGKNACGITNAASYPTV